MEIRMLQEFVTLSDIKNYAKAAEELYTTQATLSRHIIAMEKELGQPLFNRTTRRVELTDFGLDFLIYARTICQTWDECKAYLISDNSRSSLIVGISSIILEERDIKDRFTRFILDNPDCSIELVSDDDEDRLIERMRRHDLDVIVIREPVKVKDHYKRIKLYPAEPLCMLLPSDHEYAGRKSSDLTGLQEETFLLPPESSYSFKLFMERCGQAGFTPKIRSSIRGREIAGRLSSSGIGVPVMSRLAATNAANEKVSIVEIDPPILQQIDLVYPFVRKLSPSLQALIEYFK